MTKRVLITGAAKRIGRNIALAFANEGASIALHYNRSEGDAKSLAAEIEMNGGRAFLVKGNVAEVGEIERIVSDSVETLGGLDILINNVAVFSETPLEGVGEDEWNRFLDINLRAPFFFSKYAAAHLKKSGTGRIINIADSYGLSPAAKYIPYGISKAGVISMTKGLAKELAPDILVNCICLGPVLKPNFADGSKKDKDAEKDLQNAINATLLKRQVETKDITDTILMLTKNNSITGQAIFIDCGKSV